MNESNVARIHQNLTFLLDEELFAIDIDKTLEVLEITNITKIPRMPDFILGVINLRGQVIPVVDLRKKFHMPETELSVNTCIIIVEIFSNNEQNIIGLLVDSVQEVYDLETDSINAPPKIGSNLNTDFLKGIGKFKNNDIVMILDIDKVFSSNELSSMGKADTKDKKD